MLSIVRGALFGAFVSLCTLGCVWDQFVSPGVQADLVLESFDIFNDGDALLLPVDLEGKRYLFLMDTGASSTCYDSSLAAQLQPLHKQGLFVTPIGERHLDLYKSPEATVGQINLHAESAVANTDLQPAREVSGHAIYGVIGMDVLRQHIVRLDFEHGKVEFLRAVGDQPGTPLKLRMELDTPMVDIVVAGSRGKYPCLIDTGLTGLCSCDLEAKILEELEQKHMARTVGEGHSLTLDGDRVEPIYQVHKLSLGDKSNVKNTYFGTAKHNMLGLSCWRRFIVTFDFPHECMYLKDSTHHEETDARNRSGLHMLRREGRTIVAFVDKDSAGERSDIQANDVLVKIDDAHADDLRLFTLRVLLSAPGKTVALTLRRGDVEIVRRITLSADEAPDAQRVSEINAGSAARQ